MCLSECNKTLRSVKIYFTSNGSNFLPENQPNRKYFGCILVLSHSEMTQSDHSNTLSLYILISTCMQILCGSWILTAKWRLKSNAHNIYKFVGVCVCLNDSCAVSFNSEFLLLSRRHCLNAVYLHDLRSNWRQEKGQPNCNRNEINTTNEYTHSKSTERK